MAGGRRPTADSRQPRGPTADDRRSGAAGWGGAGRGFAIDCDAAGGRQPTADGRGWRQATTDKAGPQGTQDVAVAREAPFSDCPDRRLSKSRARPSAVGGRPSLSLAKLPSASTLFRQMKCRCRAQNSLQRRPHAAQRKGNRPRAACRAVGLRGAATERVGLLNLPPLRAS